MRDVKIVAYGSVSEDDERLITNYLEDKGLAVKILTVDTELERKSLVIKEQNLIIAEYAARIEELENDRTDD